MYVCMYAFKHTYTECLYLFTLFRCGNAGTSAGQSAAAVPFCIAYTHAPVVGPVHKQWHAGIPHQTKPTLRETPEVGARSSEPGDMWLVFFVCVGLCSFVGIMLVLGCFGCPFWLALGFACCCRCCRCCCCCHAFLAFCWIALFVWVGGLCVRAH